ncbi:Receptor-type guanylate cyclase gcy [Seminavis robusta]|uniref:Guanylate cyclase n=1 Tax=Seminavis robusta TaxID=568900 RepID=A0A9N8HL20_9STRA|nr:Receptor-type guanylate cyclase gcy [Seminavis robusta]|eukprot:Sro992_g228810.1 Receptor-type guanylate cyclase gcy (1277) ;mRNA; f:16145-20854
MSSSKHHPPMARKSRLMVSLVLGMLVLLCERGQAATVSVAWGGLESSYFNDAIVTAEVCEYADEIVLSHPMSIEYHDRHYVLGSLMLKAAQMTVDKINMWPNCGLSLQDGRNYSLTLQTYGDESDKNKTARIGTQIVQDNKTDFLLAGYSSSLTALLTPIAQDHRKLCLTGGSSRTSVHADRDYIFGLNPPSSAYLENAFVGTSRHGAKTVAYIAEDSASACDGVADMATKYDMELVDVTIIPEEASLAVYQMVAQNVSQINPDLMITCVRTRLSYWNAAMRAVDWVPKAQAYTYVVGTNEFEVELGATDLPFTMGVSSWDSAIPPIPDVASGWTPKAFDAIFEQAAFRRPAYQQVQQSAVVSVLAQAIERVGSFVGQNATDQIRDVIATGYFPTVYGNVSFDPNGQNAVPFLLLQYDDASTLHVLLPDDKHFTDFELYYPLPTWAERDCLFRSTCLVTGGTCDTNGTCGTCPPSFQSTGVRENATCILPASDQTTIVIQESTDYTLTVIIPTIVAVIVAAAAFIYWVKIAKDRENDSVWKVQPDELQFGDPPTIIGRGSFGVVLQAEFRGTQVAVKRVLPPRNDPDSSEVMKRISGAVMKNKKKLRSVIHHSFERAQQQEDDNQQQTMTNKSKRDVTEGLSSGTSQKGLSSGISQMSLGLTSGGVGGSTNKYLMTPPRNISEFRLREEFCKEMRTLSRLRHPCVTTVMGAVVDPKVEPMLIMEYMEHGSLQDILQNETMFIEKEMLLSILKDIASGCRFLHSADPPVLHGDLKAGNILVDGKWRAKVSDFGLSHRRDTEATGTPFFMAPELLRKESLNTKESDVYSFGILLFEAVSREDPYVEDEEEDVSDILRQIADPHINKRPSAPADCPQQLGSMMCDCIVADPTERPTFEELDKRLQRIDVRKMKENGFRGSASRQSYGRDRTTVSLFDIFPKHIAEALRDGREVKPEHRDMVTIFFSDIVGFTDISATLEPRKVASMLDRFYHKLDSLSNMHDVFKVETIGDAYMAVTNLVKDQPDDHATRIAEFSVDAIMAAHETLIDLEHPELGHLNIRCGFHSGPVVADVVGSRNPRYCLFGDTVNTSSRMESNSKRNRIHCSEASALQLEKEGATVPVTSRGIIKVKGKGKMKTFWVNEDAANPPPAMESPLDLDIVDEELDESKFFNNTNHSAVLTNTEDSSTFSNRSFAFSNRSSSAFSFRRSSKSRPSFASASPPNQDKEENSESPYEAFANNPEQVAEAVTEEELSNPSGAFSNPSDEHFNDERSGISAMSS